MARPRSTGWELKTKPSGIYYVEFYRQRGSEVDDVGRPVMVRARESCDTRDKDVALDRARRIVAGTWRAPSAATKAEEAKVVRAGQITWNLLFDHCRDTIWAKKNIKSWATAVSNCRILGGMIGSELIHDADYGRLTRLVQQLEAAGYVAGTVDRKMNAISAALTEACKMKDGEGRPWLVGRPVMPSIKVQNIQTRVISRAEEEVIFRAVEARVIAQPMRDWRRFGHLLRWLLDTGCRLGEALSAREERLEEHVREARVVNGVHHIAQAVTYFSIPRELSKNGKPRELPLSQAATSSLPYLRMTAVGGRIFPLEASAAWSMWDTIRDDVKAAGHDIDDVKLHTYRHTCLTRLARSGRMRIEDIADWAGHSSIQITITRYRHLMKEDKLPTLDVINGLKAHSVI